MAKLNLIIKAFEYLELQMLNDIMKHEEDLACEAGLELSTSFKKLKEAIILANKYVNGNKEIPLTSNK